MLGGHLSGSAFYNIIMLACMIIGVPEQALAGMVLELVVEDEPSSELSCLQATYKTVIRENGLAPVGCLSLLSCYIVSIHAYHVTMSPIHTAHVVTVYTASEY